MSSFSNPSLPTTLRSTIATLTGSNATVAVPIFRITGTVHVVMLAGVVTTVLGSNNTAAHWRLNDQTAQPVITAAAGTTLSAAGVGSSLYKIVSAGSALTLLTSAAGRFQETSSSHMDFQEFTLVEKSGANTDIEFVYTTTNTPTSGAIQFFCRYIPVSATGAVTAL